ncbi:arginine--tRNA ligase [Aurantivibrio infirmus]
MNISRFLDQQALLAMAAAGIPQHCSANVALSKNSKFGDYQINGAMAAAKLVSSNPRDLAQKIIDQLDLQGAAEKLEIAGPGFINIHLDKSWLAKNLNDNLKRDKLGVESTSPPQTIVIDYSSPNLAKEMHVGHLRSTIIGDTQARVMEFLGHQVIRQNHVGDWGTQFGMLIAELEDHLQHGEQAELALHDLESFYQQAKIHFDADEAFATRARNYVVKLQGGDEKVLELWERFRAISLKHSEEVYKKLGVSLSEKDVCGESFYNSELAKVIGDLENLKLVTIDQGAKVVYLEEFPDKEGNPGAVIVQKQDGGFLYSTSDLAAVRYRTAELGAQRVMIFVDFRQSLHFKQVFTIARKAKFVAEEVKLEHHPFGTMLGKDGKPFKTRDGGTVKLSHLLDEAVERAEKLIAEKDPDLNPDERKIVAKKVGIGAVKYADLSITRTNDYVFNWDSMLSFEGNTSPYLQYAYARIHSIFRKAEIDPQNYSANITINHDSEKQLAIKCLQFSEVLNQVADAAYPHFLCNYLYDLASQFMKFYEACPVLKEGVAPDLRDSRLQLCLACAKTIKTGLNILGIDVMEKM